MLSTSLFSCMSANVKKDTEDTNETKDGDLESSDNVLDDIITDSSDSNDADESESDTETNGNNNNNNNNSSNDSDDDNSGDNSESKDTDDNNDGDNSESKDTNDNNSGNNSESKDTDDNNDGDNSESKDTDDNNDGDNSESKDTDDNNNGDNSESDDTDDDVNSENNNNNNNNNNTDSDKENENNNSGSSSTTSQFDKIAAQNKATNDSLLADLKPKYESLREEIKAKKAGYDLGKASASIGTKDSSWTATVPAITQSHPRLLVTKNTLPTIEKALNDTSDPTVKRFYELLNYSHPTNGKLGSAQTDFDGRKGLHNYDKSILELIQVKALGYLLGGHDLYGYQAIHYMKQFLRTLNIQYISSDQCREYGNTMFTAALVYDWCYNLLTQEDKNQLIAGVENKTAKGTCGKPSYTSTDIYKLKMEVGFPPSGQGAISGHGSERQILRDYLSAAIAFYGDNNSWWNYVAARVYSEYVPVRNYYFQSGVSQQGTGVYASGRHIADMYSAWLLITATGKNPYVGIDQTVRGFLGYECAPGKIFSDGDGTFSIQNNYEFRALSYMTAYLFADEAMLAQAKDMQPTKAFESDTIELTSAMYIALCGMSDIEPADDKYEGMDLLQYNPSPVGQYVTHLAWNSDSSPAVLMRIKERNTANHEHSDAGTFMIYYKGMLTADAGVYKGYGSDHTRYYHQATVSHNGLLIYNPSKSDKNSSDKAKKWYSGGQIWPSEIRTLNEWLNSSKHKTGTVIGYQDEYADAAETKPLYAYIGGDITSAYPSDTVNFVGRRMLTVYTGDKNVPMVFFVYDTITSDSASYKKTFLLHISSTDAPTVDTQKKTVVTENGDGRLVLTCLSNGVTISKVGGRTLSGGVLDYENSKNYITNGMQNTVAYDDKTWGRVEITKTNETSTKFLNSIYVTDKGNTTYYETKPITNATNVEGCVFNNSIVAVFNKVNLTKSNCLTTNVSFTAEGNSTMRYHVDGLATGKWKVTVNGKEVGTYSVVTTARFLAFEAPSGNVTLSYLGKNA